MPTMTANVNALLLTRIITIAYKLAADKEQAVMLEQPKNN